MSSPSKRWSPSKRRSIPPWGGLIFALFWASPLVARDDFSQKLDAAVERGRAALLEKLARQLQVPPADYPMGRIALSLTALLKARLPSDHEGVARAFRALENMPLIQTYCVSCYLFALDAFWQARYREAREAEVARVGPSKGSVPRTPPEGPVRSKMEELVRWLIRGEGGTWNYEGRGPGDLSNTQFAVLGLEIGLENDLSIPAEILEAILDHLVKTHSPERQAEPFSIVYKTPAWEGITQGVTKSIAYNERLGGWNYESNPEMGPSNTMTAAAVSSLLVARKALQKLHRYSSQLSWQADRKIEAGLGWMAAHWRSYPGNYYGMYSLEKVADIGSIAAFGSVDWYDQGARFLTQSQKADGTWGDEVNTAFALLFFTRATRSHLQTLGPEIYLTKEGGRAGDTKNDDSDLVYIEELKGFLSASTLFEYLEDTREPKLLSMMDQAVRAFPPHRIHEILSRVLDLWSQDADPVTKHARSTAVKIAGVRTDEKALFQRTARKLKRVYELEQKMEADPKELGELLGGGEGPVLKKRVLDLIDRHGAAGAFPQVMESLSDGDPDVRRRAREVLVQWTGQSFPPAPPAAGAAVPAGVPAGAPAGVDGKKPRAAEVEKAALEEAARPWREWWEDHGEEVRLSRRVSVLVDRLDRSATPEEIVAGVDDLVKLGPRAVPSLLRAMERGDYSIHLVRALEGITGKSVGLRLSDWREELGKGE
jgi:hypothetical protein